MHQSGHYEGMDGYNGGYNNGEYSNGQHNGESKQNGQQGALIATATMLGLVVLLLAGALIWAAVARSQKTEPKHQNPTSKSGGRGAVVVGAAASPGPSQAKPSHSAATQNPPMPGGMSSNGGNDTYESVYESADAQIAGRRVNEATEALPAINGKQTNMQAVGSMQEYTPEEQKAVQESAEKINAGLRSSFLKPMGTEYNEATRVGPTAQAMRTYEGTVRALAERDGGLDRKRAQIIGAWGGVMPNPAQRQGPNPNDSFLPFGRSELFATGNPYYQEQYTLPSGRPINEANSIVASDNF